MANNIRISSSFDKKAEQGVKGLEDSVKRLRAQGAKGLGLGIGVAATTKAFSVLDSAISGVVQGVFSSIDAASGLNETLSKSKVIFGDNAEVIEKWGDTAAAAFGQSKRQALDTASGFAGLFQTVGLAADKAAENAKKLTELGSDLASFFNTDVQTAIDSLKSGLSGETEPLRKFNIFLSETAVSAKLAQMGIHKVGGVFTEAQKATARYALIMEQTGAAQGDFARTADGVANSQRTLAARAEDLAAKVGQVLLPVVSEAIDKANEGIDAFLGFARAIDETAKAATGSADPLGDLGTGLGFFLDAINPTIGPMGHLNRQILEMQAAADKAARDSKVLADHAHDLAGGIDDASSSARKFPRAARPMRVALDDLRERADDASAALSEALFGKAGLKGNRAGVQQELADTNKEIDKLEKIKDPTAAQRRSLTQLKGRASELKGELLEVNTKLALMGDRPTRDDLIPYLVRLSRRLGDAGDEARALLDLLNQAGVTSAGGSRSDNRKRAGGGGKAAGGPVMAGVPYVVGERGPELFVPQQSGGIVPHGAAWGGGGVVVNFNSTWPPTTQQAREIVNFIDKQLGYRAS